MAIVSETKLDFWIKNNYNVLFKGKHGVGKTHIIIDSFKRNNLKWKYFSASTMDPWVDFIGIPKEKTDGNGKSYLDLIRPQAFENDEVEAIFFDEYNRSKSKIRDAVMELIQFKSINGKKFNNLKIIWAAVNPASEDDDDLKYAVEDIDPAQEDRFHIKLDIPYKPDFDYFKEKYGRESAVSATDWWSGLPDKIKDKVSPRRLDYAVEIYSKGGDIRDVLPKESNVSKLISELSMGSVKLKLKELFNNKDNDKTKEFIDNINNFSNSIDKILANNDYIKYFIPFCEKEEISKLLDNEKNYSKLLIEELRDCVEDVLKDKITVLLGTKLNANSKKKYKVYNDFMKLNPNYVQNVVYSQNDHMQLLNDLTVTKNIQLYSTRKLLTTHHRVDCLNKMMDMFNNMKTCSDNKIIENAVHLLCLIVSRTRMGGLGKISSTVESVANDLNRLSTTPLVSICNKLYTSKSSTGVNWSHVDHLNLSVIAGYQN